MQDERSFGYRHFIQYMLKMGCVPKTKILHILTKLNVEEITNNDEDGLTLFLSKINEEISAHHFKIACVTCEITGREFVVWLNTKSDAANREQGTFSKPELEYFQIIMNEIIQSDTKCLPLNVCLNLSGTLVANVMFKTQAEKIIDKWVDDGYLVIANGRVYFGPRCIQEFSSYFRTLEDEVHDCELCSEAVFVGNTCGICNHTFHSVCLKRFLRNKTTCPNCKNQWEDAAEDE